MVVAAEKCVKDLTVPRLETIAVSNSNTHDNSLQRVEAVLFLSRTPITSRRVAQLADLEDGTQARTLIAKLNENYREKGRAFHVKRVAGGYQIRTRPVFSRWIRQLEIPNHYQRLTTPALETLTVVAYRQPIIKADIEAIRGVSCGEMLRQLLEKGLVRIVGRSEQLGHPFLYGTTKKFLADFGLNNLDSLPRGKFLRGAGLPQGLSFGQNSSNGVSQPKQVDSHHPVNPMVSKEDRT
ncbi:MAG: SMC-Scp complex subunit ScpB [Pirellulaceae bacterium]|nr:SMC-Scp complex subunit ScpB [Pirellulaceae bacterium]